VLDEVGLVDIVFAVEEVVGAELMIELGVIDELVTLVDNSKSV
jgi:hypothetical protein